MEGTVWSYGCIMLYPYSRGDYELTFPNMIVYIWADEIKYVFGGTIQLNWRC